MSKELELLKKLFSASSKLDQNYCTILNRSDFNLSMSGTEYDEINDVLIEVEKFLKEKENLSNYFPSNFKFIGVKEGVCGNEPIVLGTRLKPEQIVSFGSCYDACLEFDLSIEQVIECYLFLSKKPKINVYLDDLRDCPKGFLLAKNIDELKDIFSKYEVSILSLDHDLGIDKNNELLKTGYDFVLYFCENGLNCDKIYLHTDNVVGKDYMETLLKASQRRGFISNKISIFRYPLFPNKYTENN